MRRDLSMVRRLEKIEKEMGYCEIKLEKEQRLRTQLHFLKLHRRALEESMERFVEQHDENVGGRLLGGLALSEVQRRISIDRDEECAENLREIFRAVGALPLLRAEHTILSRELDELEEKLLTFQAFSEKKQRLVAERQEALVSLGQGTTESVLAISEEFEQIEQQWNILTEDLMNIDEAVFYVSRCVDYLQSGREFVLASRSQFAIDQWLRDGYLIDLFKHSSLGRAKEMVEGADRNLKLALVELVCLEDLLIAPEDFEHILLPFLDVLFDDLFQHGKLRVTLELLEERLERAVRLQTELQERREAVLTRQLQEEESRGKLFQQMGDERKKLTLAT
ncbi:MAG: hypothetical protein AAF581_15035 [Planctomycetota bacterium]